MKEVDVARPVVEWLRSQDYEVYQEVILGRGGGDAVADIVAVQQEEVWIIETKTSLSWDVLAQADNRKRWAHKVSVAVPVKKPKKLNRNNWSKGLYFAGKHDVRRYTEKLLEGEAIGLLVVRDWMGPPVFEQVEASRPKGRTNGMWAPKLLDGLHEAQKNYVEAGSANGGHWTPYKETCKAVLEAVTSNPGIGTKDLVSIIKHHYASESSARSALAKRAQEGLIPGVEVRKKKNRIRFYPAVKGKK
jgi:hypothetical protein